MIKPILGRVLWLNPHPAAGITEQQTAIIAKVNDDGTLNLAVFAPDGTTYAMQNVPLVQEGEAVPQSAYAQWMPYQLGQAAKTESLAERIEDRVHAVEARLGFRSHEANELPAGEQGNASLDQMTQDGANSGHTANGEKEPTTNEA